MMQQTEEYLIRFLYKNGSSDTFWLVDFSFNKSNMTFAWSSIDTHQPIYIDLNEVTSIVQLRVRVCEVEIDQ